MSVAERLLAGEEVDADELGTALFRALFGDVTGATLALGVFVWVGLYWRFGFFSNDQYTFANTLVAVAEGHLHIDRAVYGPPSGATPGTHLVDGRVYGRNYGTVVPSVVWYLLLQVASLLTDLRVVLVGAWSLAVAGTAAGVGTVLDRRRTGLLAGTALGGALFLANLAVATPLSTDWLPQLALQVTTAVAATVVVVATYRLVAECYDGRLGVFAGVVVAVGTPVGFWATLPKRHSVTAAFVLLVMYTLYRSRVASTVGAATRLRALAYVWVGLAAWVHAAEGLILLFALAAVDLPTARSNRPRHLAVVGAALAVSLLPFFATNAAISGQPFRPPRLLPGYTGDVLSAGAETSAGAESVDSTGDGTSSGGSNRLRDPGALALGAAGLVAQATVGAVVELLRLAESSYVVLFTDPGRTARIFVRTGYLPFEPTQDAAINLSVLGSMPVLGAVLAGPAAALHRARSGLDWRSVRPSSDWQPVHVVDAFTLVYVTLLLGVFLGRLPVHHMFTYRYLHPLYPIGVYWLARTPAVRRAVDAHGRTLALTVATTLLVGIPAYLGVIAAGNYALGESVQVYALVALTVAVAVTCWALLSASGREYDRLGAVVLGLGVGSMAVYLLVSGLSLFPVTGEFFLPLSRLLSEQFHFARLLGSTPPY